MPTIIKGQPTSAEIRRKLKEEGRPVVLSCSLGKDSLAAWIALEDEGIEVVPIYYWSIPGLPMVEHNVKTIEGVFGVKIHQYPHPRWSRTLNNCVFQSPAHTDVRRTCPCSDTTTCARSSWKTSGFPRTRGSATAFAPATTPTAARASPSTAS